MQNGAVLIILSDSLPTCTFFQNLINKDRNDFRGDTYKSSTFDS